MQIRKYVLHFVGSLLLVSCNGKIPNTASAPEATCKNTVLQIEEAGSDLITLNENILGRANEEEVSKVSTPLNQLKYISQLSEDTVLQDKGAQGTMIQAIAQGWQNINQYVKEAYIPFILEHAEKEDPEALVALLGLLKRFLENPSLKSYKLKPEAYQRLLIKLEEHTDHTSIDGIYAYYIGKIYSSKAIKYLSPVAPNASKAIAYYKKAISMENAEAARALGYLYYDGIEGQLTPNASKAIKYYEKAVKMGGSDAFFNLGFLYHNGMKGQLAPNVEKATEYYEKAISTGNIGAAYLLGCAYHNGIEKQLMPNAAKAIKYYKKAINGGNTGAVHTLGCMYHNGMEGQLEPNAAKAIKYYKKAISMGNARSAHNLGLLYVEGILGQLVPDVVKGIEYYEKAVSMGNVDVFLSLGVLYHNGIEGQLVPNATKAIEYYKLSVELGNADAAHNLGLLYQHGIEGQLAPNVAKAIEYYKLGVELGNADAAHNLGVLYQDGIEGQLVFNATKAIKYYEKAIKLGSANSATNLGTLYYYGMEGQLASNTVKAITYFKEAVSMGDAEAAYNLGIFYQDGIEGQLAPNTAKAIEYYEKGVGMGSDAAARSLITLYEKGVRGQLTLNKQLAFKTYHNAYLANNKSNYIKEGLLKFLVSNPPIKVDASNIAESQQELETFKENVETLTGLILLKQEENNDASQAIQFKDCYIIPELYPCYNTLIAYLEKVRNIIPYLSKYGIMVDCIKIKKNGKRRKVIAGGDHLHTYLIDGQPYMCIGENNVKAGKMLMSLLEEEKAVNQTVDLIRKMMVQGPATELGLRLHEQALKKLPSDYIGTVEEYIANRTTETLDMLDNMQALCIQLKDIAIATAPIRNKSCIELYHFLQ